MRAWWAEPREDMSDVTVVRWPWGQFREHAASPHISAVTFDWGGSLSDEMHAGKTCWRNWHTGRAKVWAVFHHQPSLTGGGRGESLILSQLLQRTNANSIWRVNLKRSDDSSLSTWGQWRQMLTWCHLTGEQCSHTGWFFHSLGHFYLIEHVETAKLSLMWANFSFFLLTLKFKFGSCFVFCQCKWETWYSMPVIFKIGPPWRYQTVLK